MDPEHGRRSLGKAPAAPPLRLRHCAAVQFEVELDPQHLERLGATAPLTGIIELIWNSLDADAEEVRVEFGRNELDGISEIRVADDGHGMTPEEAVDGFRRLGGSWKHLAGTTKTKGRALHGRDGRGRFRAAGLGRRIRWRTVALDSDDDSRRLRTRIEMRLADLIHGEVSDPEPTDEPTGTTVLIDDFMEPPAGLGGDTPIDKVTATFGLYLQSYNAHLTYDRTDIDPAKLQTYRADYPIEVADQESALLTVIEWSRRVERGLYLCVERGTPLADQPPGIQAPGFEFTAYVQWTGFASDTELAVADLGYGPTKQIIEASRETLREHFKQRTQDRTREQIEKWKEEKVYPWKRDPDSQTERAVRDVFDVVAISASSAVNSAERSGRRLSLRLLREALEQDPGSLHRVLREVLDLPEDRLQELSGLLEHTSLSALIATSKEITNRLEFLKGLESLVLGDESRSVRERSQLHRILANETWVFGEEYALAADDNSLTTVLTKHLKILGRDELAQDARTEVVDAEGSRAIVDLMLARSLSQHRNRREHLVVELKAPKVAIGDEQAAQIRRYADAVANDPRFDIKDVRWDFIIVSSEVKGMTDRERRDPGSPYGRISGSEGIRISVFTWADVIDDASHRLKFVQRLLDYQPNADQALAHLRQTHDKYLPPALHGEAGKSTAARAAAPAY